MNNDWNGQYQSISLNDVSFPCEEVNFSFSQDVVQHKKPFVPGARVESMSRNPHIFRIKALFINGLMPSPGEYWDSAQLFPQTFLLIYQILISTDNPIITFVHPTLGRFSVKCVNGSTPTTTECKNGQTLEFELIECNDETDRSIEPNEYVSAAISATAFDNLALYSNNTSTIYNGKVVIPKPDPNFTTLGQMFSMVTGIIDSTTLDMQRMSWAYNNAKYMVNRLKISLDDLIKAFETVTGLGKDTYVTKINAPNKNRATIVSKVNIPTLTPAISVSQLARSWPVVRSWPKIQGSGEAINGAKKNGTYILSDIPLLKSHLARVESGLNEAYNNKIKSARKIKKLIVEVPSTLAQVSYKVNNSIDALVKINPGLTKHAVLKEGTEVFYKVG